MKKFVLLNHTIALTALVILVVGVFNQFLSGNSVLLTTDAAIRSANSSAIEVCQAIVPHWHASKLLGEPRGTGMQLASCLKAFANGILWNNIVYGFAIVLSSIFLCRVCTRRGLGLIAMIISFVVAFWMGSNFTLLVAGHNHKPYVVLFFIGSLMVSSLAVQTSIRLPLVWGSCVGLMFLQQPDVALFFALFSGSYLVFSLWQRQGCKPLHWAKVLIPAAVVAFLFAAGPLLSGYKQHVKGAAQMQTQNKQAKWDYVTQWSFPPEEMIAFIAPGYTGWRSGEPEGPYWGRMGRSPGWEKTKQGFQNFKLENTYLGLIPVAFALFALFACRRSKHKAEILFWGGAAVVALLLSFGKFFPLYSLFYKLPVVNNIRNPNKFLQVFQVCLAILTAYGVDALFRKDVQGAEFKIQKDTKVFFWTMVGVLGGLVLWSLSASTNLTTGIVDLTAQGWPRDAAKTILQNKMVALWHASLMAAIVAAVFALFSFPIFGKILKYKNWLAAGLVLIVAADAVKLSKHYVKEMPRSYIEANALTDFIQKDLGHQRIALLSQQGIYGIWTTYLLPYNRIPTFNFSDMPRMANDYKAFLEAGQRNPLNMWRFSAVKYLLGPTAAEKQLTGQARKVFSYDLAAGAKAGEFNVVSAMAGQHSVFELLNTSPRYAVMAPIDPLPDDQALASVAQLPRPQTGLAEVLASRPGKVKLRVTAEVPALLRVAEKWDADWKATVDGESVEVQRVDFICQGVSIPAGEHEVILRYAPSRLFFYMQCAGYLILFVSLGIILLRRKGGHVSD